MPERSRPSNLHTKARDYSSSSRKQYSEPSLSQLTEQAEEALQYNDSGVQSKDLVRVNGAITSARAFIGSNQNQDSLAGPSRRTFKATYSSYDPIARRQRQSREQGEDVFAALAGRLEDTSEWLRDILTEPSKDTKKIISEAQRRKAEDSLALPAYSAPTYDPLPEYLGTTKQLWKNSKMAPRPPQNRQIPSAELPPSDTEEDEREQRHRRRELDEEDSDRRKFRYHDDRKRRERASRDPVHRRRSEELRDTRSPTPRRSEKRYRESSDEDDVVTRARPLRRRRAESEYRTARSRHRSHRHGTPSRQRSPSSYDPANTDSRPYHRTRVPGDDYQAAPPLVPMQPFQEIADQYGDPMHYSGPPVRSATIPPAYLPTDQPVASRHGIQNHSTYNAMQPRDSGNEHIPSDSQPDPRFPANYTTQPFISNAMPTTSTYTRKIQAAVEQQRPPPFGGPLKASQAFVSAHDAHSEHVMGIPHHSHPHHSQHASSLNYILNHTSPPLYPQATPPPRVQSQNNSIAPHGPIRGEDLGAHLETDPQGSLPYPQLDNRWESEQGFYNQDGALSAITQQEHFPTLSSSYKKVSQSYPIATHLSRIPTQIFHDCHDVESSRLAKADNTAANAFVGGALQSSAEKTGVSTGAVQADKRHSHSERNLDESISNTKKKIILPDRSEPGWHPPLKAAEKRRLEREASLMSQPSPSNYQSSSVKSSIASARPVKASMANVNFSLKETATAGSEIDDGLDSQSNLARSQPWQNVKMAAMSGLQSAGVSYTQPANVSHEEKGSFSNHSDTTLTRQTSVGPAHSTLSRYTQKVPLKSSGSIAPMRITPIRQNARPSNNITKVPDVMKSVKASSSSNINASDSIDDDEGPVTPSNAETPAFFRNNKTKINF